MKNGCLTLPSADFARYSISVSSFGSTVGDPLGVGLRLPDERLQPSPELRRPRLVEAMIDLAGIDEIVGLASADVEAIPLGAIQGEAGDRQLLPLRAGFLDPVVAADAGIIAVADIRHHVFEPGRRSFASIRRGRETMMFHFARLS